MDRLRAVLAPALPADVAGDNDGNAIPILRRTLRSSQIFFIVVGGVIGAGFFSGSSLILGVAGPGGALLAFAVVGVVAIAVMEGICEMILLWPIPNAMVEFVKAFVDEELAVVVGLSYWYTYSVTFSALIIGAMDLADYWGISTAWKSICFIVIPIVLAAINSRHVQVFAVLELFGGILKLLLVAAVVLLLICLNLGAGGRTPIHSTHFDDGLQYNSNVADSLWVAVCNAIPLATFSYLGIELVTMTAFEARIPISTSLRWPARNIAWIITMIYVVTTFVFVLNVPWNSASLPQLYNQGVSGLVGASTSSPCYNNMAVNQTQTYSAPVIAANGAGLSAGGLVAAFIYSTLSAANTGLYVASRAVYGLARDINIEADSPWWLRLLAAPASVEPKTLSPWWAITLSTVLLCWLPFIRLSTGYTMEELQQTLINMGSVSCTLVWSSQCLAYIMFHKWRKQHERSMKGHHFYNTFRQSNDKSNLAYFQPALAWFGLISTLLIVIVFNSASMWNQKCIGVKFASAFISPILFLALWLLLKVLKVARLGGTHWRNRRSWAGVDLSKWKDFKAKILKLHNLIHPDEIPADPDARNPEPPSDFIMDRQRHEQPPTYSNNGDESTMNLLRQRRVAVNDGDGAGAGVDADVVSYHEPLRDFVLKKPKTKSATALPAPSSEDGRSTPDPLLGDGGGESGSFDEANKDGMEMREPREGRFDGTPKIILNRSDTGAAEEVLHED